MRFSYAPFTVNFIVILAFILLCSLSAWQLQRGLNKQALLKSDIDNMQRPILHNMDITTILKNPSYYSKRIIKLKGSFQNNRNILLDNRIHNRQVGYEVITPFLIESNHSIFINRGWIPIGTDRKQLPQLPTLPQQVITIKGNIMIPAHNRFIKNSLEQDRFSIRVQALDFAPLIVQLSPDSPFSFEVTSEKTHWLTPEKHFAYALQWLLLAFSLIIIKNYRKISCFSKRM